MQAVDILVDEHRLIKHMVKLIEKNIDEITENAKVNTNFIITAVDFFRTYADRYHHGKEEGILFRGLSQKTLSDVDKKMMYELIMEHGYARKTVGSLENSKEEYVVGKTEALNDILHQLKALVELYPKHIEKEDKHFFYPTLRYFTEKELENMLASFREFDRNFTNKRYSKIVSTLEGT